jgi:hypothetical protein
MSRFVCACGVVTRGEEEPIGASSVAYSRARLHEMEATIADHVTDFAASRDGERRRSWLNSYFGPEYPDSQCERDVIEDIVSSIFNDHFAALFRCPSCERIAVREDGADGWTFFRVDSTSV